MRFGINVLAAFATLAFHSSASVGAEHDTPSEYTLREYDLSDLIAPAGERVPGKVQESVVRLAITVLADDSVYDVAKAAGSVGLQGSRSLVNPNYLSKNELSVHAAGPASVVVRATDNGHARLGALIEGLRKTLAAASAKGRRR